MRWTENPDIWAQIPSASLVFLKIFHYICQMKKNLLNVLKKMTWYMLITLVVFNVILLIENASTNIYLLVNGFLIIDFIITLICPVLIEPEALKD